VCDVGEGGEFVTKCEVQGITLECVQGDITQQPDVEAAVNAANG